MSKGIIVNKERLYSLIKKAFIEKNYCSTENKSWVANGGLCSSINSKKDCLKCWIEELKRS